MQSLLQVDILHYWHAVSLYARDPWFLALTVVISIYVALLKGCLPVELVDVKYALTLTSTFKTSIKLLQCVQGRLALYRNLFERPSEHTSRSTVVGLLTPIAHLVHHFGSLVGFQVTWSAMNLDGRKALLLRTVQVMDQVLWFLCLIKFLIMKRHWLYDPLDLSPAFETIFEADLLLTL